MERTNQEELAKRCGVSRACVSAALSSRPSTIRLSKATRQRILDEVERLGYRPHAAARHLSSGRSHRLVFSQRGAFGVSELGKDMMRAAAEVAARRGYSLGQEGYDLPDSGPSQLDLRVQEDSCDGAILHDYSGARSRHPLGQMRRRGLGTVLVESRPQKGVTSVNYDDCGGGHAAVAHLLELGRRHIVYLAPEEDDYWVAQRYQGYKQAHAEAGLDAEPDLLVRTSLIGWQRAVPATIGELLRRARPVDAIFAANDTLALASMRALLTAGRRVPDDVALVGVDDDVFASQLVPSLTSIRQDPHALGRLAANLLVDEIEGRAQPGGDHIVPNHLVVRESTVGYARQAV